MTWYLTLERSRKNDAASFFMVGKWHDRASVLSGNFRTPQNQTKTPAKHITNPPKLHSNDRQNNSLPTHLNNHNSRCSGSALCDQDARVHRRVDRWGWLWSQSASLVLASNDGASCLLLNLRELSSLGQSSVLHMKSRDLGTWSKRSMESRPSGASSTLLACGPQMGPGRFKLPIS
jgi:hypothetical protein